MPIEASEITPDLLDAVNDSLRSIGHDPIELYGLSAALRDFLNLPETRRIVAEAVEREHAAVTHLREWLGDLADELAEDSSGDWGEEHDPIGVGWQRACEHYAAEIRKKLAEMDTR